MSQGTINPFAASAKKEETLNPYKAAAQREAQETHISNPYDKFNNFGKPQADTFGDSIIMDATALKGGDTMGESAFQANDRDETLKAMTKKGASKETSFVANDRDEETDHQKLLKINKEMSEEQQLYDL